MTKKILSILLITALMVFITGCGTESGTTATTAAIQEDPFQEQPTQAPASAEALVLKDWTLTPTVWSDGNGATVTFTATPVTYTEGLRAALSIRIGDLEAESTNCNWDGSAFTGSVELMAADGYSYYCILFSADGTTQELELTSPENITDEVLVNMGTSLSAYANFVLEDWEATGSSLNIKSGYIQCQMPRITSGGKSSSISDAALVLLLNGEEVSRKALDIPAGEGEGSFELSVVNQSIDMPAMEDDYHLELCLEVTLDTGNSIRVTGGSWYSNGGELQLVVG